MPAPWDTPELIESNLLQIATLKVGDKLGRPDEKGYFKKHTTASGRESADSINHIAQQLEWFFKRAILVAVCEEAIPTKGTHLNPQMDHSEGRPASLPPRKVLGLLSAVVSIGLPNLETTYSRDSSWYNKKTNQRQAVGNLRKFILDEIPRREAWIGTTATDAFHYVRAKYKEGYKSSNKRYVASPDGKYKPAGLAGVGSTHPQTLEDRERQRRMADRTLSTLRTKRSAEDFAKGTDLSKVNQRIASLESVLNQYAADYFGAGTTYRSLDRQSFSRLHAAIKAIDAGAADDAVQKRDALKVLDEARRILQTKAAPSDPWMAKAGNCSELARLARLRLEQDHLPFICEVLLSGSVDGHEGDHVFTIFGLRLPNHYDRFSAQDLFLKKDDRRHLRSAWIIDPWVNVCCRIDEYPSRFFAKMQEWSGKGKQIAVAGNSGTNWIDPHPISNIWYARSIYELDWKIKTYRPYDPEVFQEEDNRQATQQTPAWARR